MTLDEDTMRLNMWDATDSGVLRSVHAYLAWHSGSVFRNSIRTHSNRSELLDRLASEAGDHAIEHGADLTDSRRIRSLMSLDTQTQHERGTSPVCYLDIELIDNAYVLPFVEPNGFDLQPLIVGYPRYEDYDDFKAAYRDLAYYMQYYPTEVDYQLMRLQRDYLVVANYEFQQEVDSFHFIPPEWHIVGVPSTRERRISQLNLAHDVGQIVKVAGQVIEVSLSKTTYTDIAWKCKDVNCRQVHFVEQDSFLNTVAKPEPSCGKYQEMQIGESNGCNSKHFLRLPPPMSNAMELQRLTIQENTLDGGEAKTIKLEVRGSLKDTLRAGQGVEIAGVLMTEPISKGSLLEDKFIRVRSVTEKTDLFSQVIVNEKDREEIQTFVDSFDFTERMDIMIDWHAGRIHAEEHIKKAIMLQACGGVENKFSETGGNFHILLVGDPGTAKSKLLKLASKLHPQSRFTNAQNASQAGLTAGCMQVEDMYTGKRQWALVPGTMALTHEDAVCAIDELNLYKGNMGDLHDALESGEVFVDKIVKGRVITNCAVISGCNPDNGNKKKWIRGEQLSFGEQIELDFAMQQRFAAIFVLQDIPDAQRDEQIGLSMLKGITEGEDTEVDPSRLQFIQKYIAMTKEITPLLTPAAAKYMAKEHARKRAENEGGSDTLRSHRQVNALARLTTAIARFDFSTKATMNHVRYAESILAETLEEKDPGLINTGKTNAERQVEEECKSQITLYFDQLSAEAKEKVHNAEQIHQFVLEQMDGKGWREPTQMETDRWLQDVARKSEHIEKWGEDKYAVKKEA